MEDVLLLIVITYGISLSLGYLLQKYLKIPWMFAALFFGIIISAFGFFASSIKSEPFELLATLGMLVILFMIGFNLELKEIRRLKNYIFLGTAFIISLEGFSGSLLLYFGFPAEVNNSFLIALITALSFATVGEAILLPILAQFNVVNTTFGQLTLGIGTLDDVIEVLMLALVTILPTFLPQAQVQNFPNPLLVFFALGGIFLLALVIRKLGGRVKDGLKNHKDEEHLTYLLILLIFFSFVALGGIVFEGLATVGAILAGVVTRGILPEEKLKDNEKAINFLGYVFLSPFFFLSVGAKVSITNLLLSPLLIVLIWIVAKGSKLLGSFLLFRKMLGNKYSLLMGLGLSVRFSTSLIVQYILFSSGLISLTLYSALIATAIIMKPVIIGIYSWGLSKEKPP